MAPSLTRSAPLLAAMTAAVVVVAGALADAPRTARAHHAPGHGGSSPTATPTGGGGPLDTGWVYYDRLVGDVRTIFRTSADGSVNEQVVGAPGEYDPHGFGWAGIGVPSHATHDGDRWYLSHVVQSGDTVFPNVSGPYFQLALEIDAIREGDALGTRLTDNAGACIYVWSFPAWAPSAAGAPDAAVTWAGAQWADLDGDAAGTCETLVSAGIFRADLTYDAAGAVTGMSTPVLAVPLPTQSGNVPNLWGFDWSPDGATVAYSRETGGLWVGAAGSPLSSHTQIVTGRYYEVTWSADQATGTPGLQTTIAFNGWSSGGKAKNGTWSVQPGGGGLKLLAEARQAKTSSQSYFIHHTPFWSPAGSHLAYTENETGGPLGITAIATVRRMAKDGTGNVALQGSGGRLLGWTGGD